MGPRLKTGAQALAIFGLLIGTLHSAMAAVVQDARIWPSQDKTRLVFDLSDRVKYKIFTLDHPDRIVIDFIRSRAGKPINVKLNHHPMIKQLRSGINKGRNLRVVVDARQPLKIKHYLLAPGPQYGNRLVVEMTPMHPAQSVKKRPARPVKPAAHPAKRAFSRPTAAKPLKTTGTKKAALAAKHVKLAPLHLDHRDAVVIIDAGHGGVDPGALGYRKTHEKDLVFGIARKLKTIIDQTEGMRAIMTRDGDYFLSLRERTRRARKQKADLFISIHADAFRDRHAHGSSVYILSNQGASSEAAHWLADNENAADLIGGVKLHNKDNMLASVLLDLSQTGTIEASHNAARMILRQLGRIGHLHKNDVQRAGFVVLKSLDIPSVLVETAFISNPQEERRLSSNSYQWKLADALAIGIQSYFNQYPPPGVQVAMRKPKDGVYQYKIRRGDTLSEIAQQYRVTVDRIRHINNLKTNLLRIGQVIHIPVS